MVGTEAVFVFKLTLVNARIATFTDLPKSGDAIKLVTLVDAKLQITSVPRTSYS